jgi:hypothetical protein
VRDLVHFYPEVKVGYTRLVTISTDNLLKTNEFRDGEGAQWPFLSDPERVVQRDLDIQEYTDPTNNPMIPHTLVLEPNLKIYKIYNGYWFWGRPSISELWSDLREVTPRTCAPPGSAASVIGSFPMARNSVRSGQTSSDPGRPTRAMHHRLIARAGP